MAESYRLVRNLKEKENLSIEQYAENKSRPDWH